MAEIVVKEILEAGVHYGHRSSRWNPKMRPYIYGRRNLIHIIDIKETVRGILRAQRYLQKVSASGSLILFVGTKRQAAEPIIPELELSASIGAAVSSGIAFSEGKDLSKAQDSMQGGWGNGMDGAAALADALARQHFVADHEAD